MDKNELYELSKRYYCLKKNENLDVVRLREILKVNIVRDILDRVIVDEWGNSTTVSAESAFAEIRARGIEPYIYKDKEKKTQKKLEEREYKRKIKEREKNQGNSVKGNMVTQLLKGFQKGKK